MGYLVGTVGAVVALCYFAAHPVTYVFWFAGFLSVLALAVAQHTKIGALALAATGLCLLLFPWLVLRYTSLQPSIEAGSAAHVHLLLLCGANPNELRQHDTPLIAAVRGCRADIVEELLRHGADPNGRSSAFMNSTPALFDAARMQCPMSMVGLLLRYGADPNQRNNGGETALFHAIRFGELENTRQLLQAGARINAKSKTGETPLDVARQVNYQALETLLRAPTAP
ncbi:ankyrin repeat domain-containing protein [Hymenobacter volaticus]|uniref:Ankyrin repeat domain-containing protein n=1 Tax=Hymenobacter volaticus TaxID=2932254 RepID=A0ABY4G7L9_9BACT|nr:ankyrin repeat domain-containing protein [Hymenobacter volaticus]